MQPIAELTNMLNLQQFPVSLFRLVLNRAISGFSSTLSEYLSLFIMFLLTTGRIDRGLPFTVADFHLTDDLLYGGIPPR